MVEMNEISVASMAWLPLFFMLPLIFPFWLLFTLLIVFVSCLTFILRNHGNTPYHKSPTKYPTVYNFKDINSEFLLQNNIFQAFTFPALLAIVVRYWRNINWQKYSLRILCLFMMGILNSTLGFLEYLICGNGYVDQALNTEPVFILGHPRTGTTLLHNLLALDTRNFHFPSTFQCGFQHAMILLKDYTSLFKSTMGDTRPMDNMKLGLETPQEDELAYNAMTAGLSPYMPLGFMEVEPEFRKYYTFETCSPEEKQTFIDNFLLFLKKITFVQDKAAARRVVLKSPVHTARGKLFYNMFPNSQFIYIHRNPYTVFKSAANMAEKTYTFCYMTSPTKERIQDFILEQYVILYNEYINAKKVLPKESLFEVSYDELTADIVGTIQRIYDYFHWENFEDVRAIYEEYAKTQEGFKKNDFVDLDPKLKEIVYEKWKDSFETFGYKK